MKTWIMGCSMLLTMMWSACSSIEKEPQTLFHFEKMNEKSCKLSELLTDVEIIPLETNDSSLLDVQAKYLAIKGSIYASSMNEIFKFDGKGKFVGKLSRIGQGPGDYTSINDYEVVSRSGKLEIWIAHNRGISRYDEKTLAYLDMIPTRSSIESFTYISDETIIVKTTEEYTFHLCNMEGTFRHAFLKKDLANLTVQLLPFIEMDGRKFYCIDQTDEAVVYNEQTDSLELLKYASGNIDKLLTRKDNQEYMERYGYLEQAGKVEETFTRLVTVRRHGDASIAFLRSPKDEKMLVRRGNGNEWDSYMLHPKASIESDLLPGMNVRFLVTAVSCDSDDSFICCVHAPSLAGTEINGKVIDEEDNPVIVKYRIR